MRRALPLLALMVACSSPTELMLVVKAGPGLTIGDTGQIDALHVRAQPADDPRTTFFFDKYVELCTMEGPTCRPQPFASADYDDALTLPIHFLLEPGDKGLDEDVRVWVDALSNGVTVLASGVRFRFSKGRRLWLDLPLFTQCLGMLTCEEEDLACGYDTDCVAYTPTTTDTNDASPTHDLALSGGDDLAVACGGDGQACCGTAPHQSCDSALTCNANGVCYDMQAQCGEVGDHCCTPDGGPSFCNSGALLCDGTNTCVQCGGPKGPCCGTTCNPGNQCTSGTCTPCGDSGMACCANQTCNSPALVCDAAGQCMQCGPPGTDSYNDPTPFGKNCAN